MLEVPVKKTKPTDEQDFVQVRKIITTIGAGNTCGEECLTPDYKYKYRVKVSE